MKNSYTKIRLSPFVLGVSKDVESTSESTQELRAKFNDLENYMVDMRMKDSNAELYYTVILTAYCILAIFYSEYTSQIYTSILLIVLPSIYIISKYFIKKGFKKELNKLIAGDFTLKYPILNKLTLFAAWYITIQGVLLLSIHILSLFT